MSGLESVLSFVLGACLGSFLNVVAYRLPKEDSLLSPGSCCPQCGKPIAWSDNIPVFSWVWLKGRCRRCRRPISPRYPIVELAMGLLSFLLWQRWRDEPIWAVLVVCAAGLLLAVALIDWDTFLIPDELSLGLALTGLLTAPLNPFFAEQSWFLSMGKSLLGALIGFFICWSVAVVGEFVFKKEAMGGGDVKLMAGIGAWTGGLGAFDAILVASFLGSGYGLFLIARGSLKRSDPIPFGPFLSAAAVFNFFLLLPFGFPFVTW